MSRNLIVIDRDKLRAEVRKLGNERVFYMLDDAIELLSPAKLHKLAKNYLDLERLRPDAEQATTPSLLKVVKRFEKASLAGEYYESFNVNSKNYTQKSAGTTSWITDYLRLLDRCVTSAKKNDSAEVREAMDILFALLSHIDKGNDDIIFFADEGGSWQVGVDWAKVLPVWFKVLSSTASRRSKARNVPKCMGYYCRICGRSRPNEQFSGRGHRIHICKKCQRMPWEKRDRIERFDELHGFLHQSMISVKNVARLDTLTGHEDHQVAELAALILEIARVLPGKRNRWLKLVRHDRPLFNRAVELFGVEFFEDLLAGYGDFESPL